MYIGEVTVTNVRAVLLTMGNVDRGGNSNECKGSSTYHGECTRGGNSNEC